MRSRAERVGVATVVLTALWIIVAMYPIQAALPENPVSLPGDRHIDEVRRIAPEGWAFFTRDPREARNVPYVRAADGDWEEAHAGPHAHPRWAFGLNRSSRAQGVEVGLLYPSIPEEAWQDCDGPPERCLPSVPVTDQVDSDASEPTLCGDVAIVRQELPPWAWSVDGDPPVMPSEVARLEVRCP